MKFAIVSIDVPTNPTPNLNGLLQSFRAALAGIRLPLLQKRSLGAHSWLLELESETGVLAALLSAAKDHSFGCRVLYLADRPTEYVDGLDPLIGDMSSDL